MLWREKYNQCLYLFLHTIWKCIKKQPGVEICLKSAEIHYYWITQIFQKTWNNLLKHTYVVKCHRCCETITNHLKISHYKPDRLAFTASLGIHFLCITALKWLLPPPLPIPRDTPKTKEFWKGESLFDPCVNAIGQRPYCLSRMEVSYCIFVFGAIIRRDLRT